MRFSNYSITAIVICKLDMIICSDQEFHIHNDSYNVFLCKKSILEHTHEGWIDEASLFYNKLSKHLKILSVKNKDKAMFSSSTHYTTLNLPELELISP